MSSHHHDSAVSLRSILALALPTLGVLSATPLYLLLDTAVVGRMLHPVDLAALGAGATILAQVTTQLTFLSYGTTARSARLFGDGKTAEAIMEGVQATWTAIVVGLVLATAIFLSAPWILDWLTGEQDVADFATTWVRIACMAIPLTLIVMAGNGWMRGVQNARLPFYFTLAGVIPGAVSVPVLVDRFGLPGSAVATVLGMAVMASCFLIALVHSHKGSFRPSWRIISSQLILGRDLILRSLSFQVAFLSAVAVVARFGAASLAGYHIMLQLWSFISLVLDSLAIAAQSLVGAALGKGSARHARTVGDKVIGYSAGVGVILALVFAVGHRAIPSIFTNDAVVVSAMTPAWWILSAMIVLGGVVFAVDGVLLGAADAVFLRNATIASVVLGFLPGVWITFALDAGLAGVWCGLAAFILIRLIAGLWRYRSMRWASTGARL